MGKAFAFPIVTRSMRILKTLRLHLLEGREHDLGQGRDAGDTRAGGVVDGVEDGRVRGVQRGLAAAGGAVGAVGGCSVVASRLLRQYWSGYDPIR